MSSTNVSLISLLSFLILLPTLSFAQVRDSEFKDWEVYTTTLQGKKACYVASNAKSKKGNYKKRDEPYLLVTSISPDVDEVSTSSGYKYKLSSDVRVTIDGEKYTLFTKGEHAWATDSIKDAQIVKSMKAKNFLTVKGTSIKGTYSEDRYSLSGFTAAYDRMKDICGHTG